MGLVLSAAEYRALVDHSPVMIWRSGTDALCDYFNDTWLEFTGRTMEQEVGNGWAEGVHPDDLQPCVDHYLERFGKRQSFEMEYRLRRHDGVYRYIFDRGTPFCGDDGSFKGFIGSCVDIDDRRRAEADRDRQHEQKIESARQFERWVVEIVSHDIRDPLGVVDFAARTLLKEAGDPEAVKRAAGRATRGVDRIKHIVGDLLDLSRARHGGVPVTLRRVDLHRICAEVVDEFKEAAAREGWSWNPTAAPGAASGTSIASSRRSRTWSPTRSSTAPGRRRSRCASRRGTIRSRSRCTTKGTSRSRSGPSSSIRSLAAKEAADAAADSGSACSSPRRSPRRTEERSR